MPTSRNQPTPLDALRPHDDLWEATQRILREQPEVKEFFEALVVAGAMHKSSLLKEILDEEFELFVKDVREADDLSKDWLLGRVKGMIAPALIQVHGEYVRDNGGKSTP